MRIVYIILAHKLPEQVVRLVRKLNTDNVACFLIHVDKKADSETYRRIFEPLSAYKNVFLLKRHVRYYGDFNHLRATLDGLQKISSLNLQYDYVMLLTGQDYPIKSNEHMQKILWEGKGASFIEYFRLPSEHWKEEDGGLDRINYWHFNLRGQHFALGKKNRFVPAFLNPLWSRLVELPPLRRVIPLNFKLFFGGSAYWCLSRDCIEYINDFVQQNSALVKFFKYVNIPEESFFQTILLNSPLNNRIVDNNLWHIVWSTSRHPAVLRKQDFESLMGTDKLFARKFDITTDESVLDMIDQATS